MKTAFIDDEYDIEEVKKYIERKNLFETKITQTRQTQEVYKANQIYDSIYAYGYDWTVDYDTIYNGYYDVEKKMYFDRYGVSMTITTFNYCPITKWM